MQKLFVVAAAAALCVPVAASMAQDMPTEPVAANVDRYMVHMIKFKPGKRARANEIIDDYFIPTDQSLGRTGVIDIHLDTGEWDGVVAFPMTGGVDELNWAVSQSEIDWMNALAQRAGGMQQAQAILNEWDSLVEREVIHLGHIDKD